MRWTRLTIMLLALIASIAIGGCASDGAVTIAACAHDACGPVPYRIGPGDVLQVSVWKNPQLDRTEPVRPGGKISLPLLNDVRAAGLTPMQLRDKINARLTHFLTDPQVTVTVIAVHSLAVSVLGQVRHPGRYHFSAQPSVLEALAAAGGLTPFADSSEIVIIRRDGSRTERIPYDYPRMVAAGGSVVLLRPNDVVVVP